MGDHADDLINSMIDHWGYYDPPRRRSIQKGVGLFMWASANGVIPMESMTTMHILNAMKVCERNGNTGKLKQLGEILEKRSQQEPYVPHKEEP